MNQNTFKHISDESVYTWFDPTGTRFPTTVKNVQDALELVAPIVSASESQQGIIEIATQAEVNAGTDDTKAVTPFKLAQRLAHPNATTSQVGVIQLATNAEAQTGTNTEKAIVPSSLKHVFDWTFTNRLSTESVFGVIKLSNEAAAKAGVDHTTAMTPLRVKQAIAEATKLIPSYTTATEAVDGLVRLATIGQTQAGTLRNGYAISPYTLMNLNADTTKKGIVRAATQAEAYVGTNDSLYISAKGFKTYIATTTNVGTVKLTDTVGSGGAGTALAYNAKVVPSTGGTMTGDLNVNANIKKNGVDVPDMNDVIDHSPVGITQMWMTNSDPTGGKWMIANGRGISKTTYPELFLVLGYQFGGSGDTFNLPDMRGLFVRGSGVGKDIQAETGLDKFGKPKLGNYVAGDAPGSVQKQQMREHKHLMPFGQRPEAIPGRKGPFGNTVGRRNSGASGEDRNNFWFFTNDGHEFDPEEIRDEQTTLNTIDAIGNETRPWNMSVNYIIKVK